MRSLRCQRTAPEDVLSCLSALVPYLSQSKNPRIAIGYRPAINYARRLVFVRITKGEGRDMWLMSPHWRERLKLVGIDPVTFEIRDQNRFNLAWNQIATTKTFHIVEQRVAINRGEVAPAPQAIERHWIQSPKDKVTKPKAFAEQDNDADSASDENPYTTVLRRAIKRQIVAKGGIY